MNTNSPTRVKIMRSLLTISVTAAILATIFTLFTPLGITYGLTGGVGEIFSPPSAFEADPFLPTPTPSPRPTIGIVVGHWGYPDDDVGATCPDGLTELNVNLDIATRTQAILQQEGFNVDLLREYDERLEGYKAVALVSIHADSCLPLGNEASGFKVAYALATARPDKANRLVSCIYSRYSETTGMPFHAGITPDMTSYHGFEEIHSETAAAIIETGFLFNDRQILTQQPDLLALGIANGVLCYIRNEDASLPDTNQP
ncbi:MAG: N-acetylmuramoyl-L-alanine amidase [Anaerolineales bacterium]|nr:N-acetylmuramoyl-L-alanine amidase [Anaerolineales bacterium]